MDLNCLLYPSIITRITAAGDYTDYTLTNYGVETRTESLYY